MDKHTHKPEKARFCVCKDAKCGPQITARKRFFRGALQNPVFCNAPSSLSKKSPKGGFFGKME